MAYHVAMHDNPWRAPRLSFNAMQLMSLLVRRGGSMRVEPLVRADAIPADHLAQSINELAERGWVDIVWLGPLARRSPALPERFRDARRIATTHTGRHCHRFAPRY